MLNVVAILCLAYAVNSAQPLSDSIGSSACVEHNGMVRQRISEFCGIYRARETHKVIEIFG